MKEIRLSAHAKINMSLEVVGKRPDGYHDILSLMQGTGLCDVITIKKCPKNGTKYNLPHCTTHGLVVYLCTASKTIPTDMSNLALKGTDAVLEAVSDRLSLSDAPEGGLLIDLDKRLPVAAGIAGGSGNAAVCMLGLNALMGHPFSLRELMDIGCTVGADVPFSIMMNAFRNKDSLRDLPGIDEACDAAWIGGIGDKVEPTEAIGRYIIMANPGISVSTPAAYAAMDEIGYGHKEAGAERKLFVNDLEAYALSNYPEAAALKEDMKRLLDADEVLMSGSGPTMVAYYTDKEKSEHDAALLIERTTDTQALRVWLTSTGII